MVKDRCSRIRACSGDGRPCMPTWFEIPVFQYAALVQIVRTRVGQMYKQLLESRLPTLLRIEKIESLEGPRGPHPTQPIGKSREVNVVARRVPSEREDALDAKDFLVTRDCDAATRNIDFCCFEGLLADELSHPCLDTVKTAQDENRLLGTCGLPSGHGFELCQHKVKARPEVTEGMLCIL